MPKVNKGEAQAKALPKELPVDPMFRELVGAGAPVGDAVRIAVAQRLRVSTRNAVSALVSRYALAHRANTSAAISGDRPPDAALLDALSSELGGSPEAWAELLKRSASSQCEEMQAAS